MDNMFEKEQLNSLVNSCQEEIRRLKKQLQERPKEYVFIGNAQNKTRDFINQITKDNKQLKEQLLATQTNEETFRLEMEDITRILGLDEDTIFDDVKTYARSLKENKILRENAEHNDKVVDKVNWENMLLKKENKQLKEEKRKVRDYINKHCVNEKISKEVGYKCYTMADTNELEKIMKILGDK